MRELDKTYDHKSFENRLYNEWIDEGDFKADENSEKEAFSMVMPPPNVTGNLHLGHAINNTLQDILARWKRMDGYEVLWLPGTDHASIATEAKVVEKLKANGISKDDLTRGEFLEEAWDWTHEYGGNIRNQLKKLGVSCDWSRESFTLDDHLSEAVVEAFIKLYEKGYLYRGDRIVNWCVSCETAISDIEVEHEDEKGKMWSIKYPIKGEDDGLIIATTRPETLLGDLAVAVNPEDERYKDLIGKTLILPLVGREIPIVADDYVDETFGSGAVKITPSHDPNDFEVGQRHDLGQEVIMDHKGKIVDGYGKYTGLDRYEAREEIIKDLEKEGFLITIEDHDHAVGHCERCSTTIEPLISKQWFVKMEELAKPAIDIYKEGKLKFYPERFGKIYLNWLENIRDWCISRQLYWGHRIPAYWCQDCGKLMVAKSMPEACEECGSKNIKQSDDTLDTWFSSALWPFSTLGWPNETDDYKKFFPTNTLVTGYDIIFFWVIRMVFMSLEMTGELPFKDVYLNGLVLDEEGRKMSKSLGNGIDPLEVIDEYGADALRFTLVTGNTPGNDMRFYLDRVESSRNFANKLWNASRFVLMHIGEEIYEIKLEDLESPDKWILNKLENIIDNMNKNLEKYELGIAASNLYSFIWNDFCDWYIELVKDRLFKADNSSKNAAKATLSYVLEAILKLLHPFMPFITEEIYAYLPGVKGKIINAPWLKQDEAYDFKEASQSIDLIIDAISSIRNAKSEMDIKPSLDIDLYIHESKGSLRAFRENEDILESLVRAKNIKYIDSSFTDEAISIVKDGYELYIPLEGLIDFEKELERIQEDKEKAESELARAKKQLSNTGFVNNAPEAKVQEERDKVEKYQSLIEELEARIKLIKEKI